MELTIFKVSDGTVVDRSYAPEFYRRRNECTMMLASMGETDYEARHGLP